MSHATTTDVARRSKRRFRTDYVYSDRATKARYVGLKYAPILTGGVLDVGCDECHLKRHLPAGAEYWGIGRGGRPDQNVDLEKQGVPFADESFDCVLCLDVLEHLESIHAIFDDLCRVTRRYVIVSLPNPWGEFHRMLCHGDYRPGQPMKFYGLPPEPPEDRHKWFFSAGEARDFILHRAARNGMRVLQIDSEDEGNAAGHGGALTRTRSGTVTIRNDFNRANLYTGTLWAVLEKPQK